MAKKGVAKRKKLFIEETAVDEGPSDGKRRLTERRSAVERPLPPALPPVAAAALVFVAAGAVLMLEILAVRMLAPYVGLTLETTTSIIGAALAGIAVGAAVGGYFADRTNTRLLIVGLLVGGGLLTLLTVPIVRLVGPGVRGDGEFAALGVTVLALVPAAAVLSAVSPSVAHLQLHSLQSSGTIVGRLSAWATAGALIGTFGTGFVVIPLMPVSTAVLLIGMILMLVGIILGATGGMAPSGLAAMVFLALAFGALSGASGSPCARETNYHCMNLSVKPRFAKHAYHLILDTEYNSYVNLDDPTDLAYAYTQWIGAGINGKYAPGKALDAVFVGGGAFTLPRWLNATRPGSQSVVLELDGDVVSFDEEKLALRTSPHLRVSVGDARIEMLHQTTDSADLVVGDAFSGLSVPWHLTTTEWIDEVKRVVKPGGLYLVNLVDSGPMEFIKAEAATLLDAFPAVRMIAYVAEEGEPAEGNVVIVASDKSIPSAVRSRAEGTGTYGRRAVESFAGDAEVLQDDYAPVDQLLTITGGLR